MRAGCLIDRLKTIRESVLADGRIEMAETDELLAVTRALAARHGLAFADFEKLLLKCREDGRISADESERLAVQLDCLCALSSSSRAKRWLLSLAALVVAVSAAAILWLSRPPGAGTGGDPAPRVSVARCVASLVFMTGSDGLDLSTDRIKALREAITVSGNTLVIDDGDGNFESDVRLLVQRILPGFAFAEIPDDDPLFLSPIELSADELSVLRRNDVRPKGIRIGDRLAVFYYPGDLRGAWKAGASVGGGMSAEMMAFRFGVNLGSCVGHVTANR